MWGLTTQAIQKRIEPREAPRYAYSVVGRPALKAAMEATEPSVLFCGPWGSGKTRLLAEKAYWLCGRYPGYKAALCRRELKHLKRTTWKWLIDFVIPPHILRQSKYNKQEVEVLLPNGSEIHGCGLDNPQKLASTEYGFIGLEEATEITDELTFAWLESRARQPGVPFHQVMYACNAGPPSHYLYQTYYVKKLRDEAGRPLTRLIEGETLWDLLPESYKKRLQMLRGRYRERFLENKWIGYEGLIYDVFNPASMLIPRFRIPEGWDYVIGIDFGFHSPFVCQFWAISPDGVWYLDKEIYQTQRTVNVHVRDILALMEQRNLIAGPLNEKSDDGEARLRSYVAYSDHDAEDQATLEEFGISTLPADKAVSAGIQTVYDAMAGGRIMFFEDALHERDPMLEATGKPTSTVEEIQGYIWKTDAKEEPRKENDHGMDAMRYAFYSHERRPMPGLFVIRGGRYGGD